MPKSTPTCNSIINLMYRETTWANVAENASAAPITDTYTALHTANLTAATDSQAENETAYTNYARESQDRGGGGWDAASGGATATGQWWGDQQEAVVADVGARNTGGWFTEVLPPRQPEKRIRAKVDRGRKEARQDDVAAAALSALLRELKGIEERTARLSAEWAARKREIEQPAPQPQPAVIAPDVQPEPQSFLDAINVEYDISDVLSIDVESPDGDLTAILMADIEGMDNGIEQALASIDVGVFDDDIDSILMD